MGERFLQIRWYRPDSEVAGEWAIPQQGKEAQIQRRARGLVGKVFKNALQRKPPALSNDGRRRIAALAEVVALGRTHVFRSSYGNREIEYIPEPEANTRISKGLAAIAKGIAALTDHPCVAAEDLQDVVRVRLDWLPENRRRLLEAVMRGEDLKLVHIPETVRRRELEDLEAHGILQKDRRQGASSEANETDKSSQQVPRFRLTQGSKACCELPACFKKTEARPASRVTPEVFALSPYNLLNFRIYLLGRV